MFVVLFVVVFVHLTFLLFVVVFVGVYFVLFVVSAFVWTTFCRHLFLFSWPEPHDVPRFCSDFQSLW